MEKNKIIIIVLIVVIVALLIAIAATTMPSVNKKDTNVTYKGKSKITEGDTINLKLTDVDGTPLANQTVNVTVTDKDKSSSYYSVVTNAKGIGKLKSDKSAGNYTVFISYGGNEIYNACNFTKKIVIEDKVVEAEPASSSQSSSLPYSLNNLPPSNDPNPETNRYQIDEYHVVQEYSDNYRSTVDLRTGERHGGFF
jgi:hypothetical protein